MPGYQSFLRRLQYHAPNWTQLVGFLTLILTGGILLFLTFLTLTAALTTLIFLAPVLLLTSPIWAPIMFVALAGFLTFSAIGVAAIAAATWMYKYFTGRHPVGSNWIDYAFNSVKGYAVEFGGYVNRRVKDAVSGS